MTAPEREITPLSPGTTFHGRYEVVRCIKSGGMGSIYEVVHLETRRRRALKTMLPTIVSDPDLRARFKLEATVAAEIESEHIVETFDAGVDAETGLPFLVMELLKGDDLGNVLAQRGRLPAPEVVVLLHQASLALDRTHAAGIVHRDLKPDNLFVSKRDDGSPRLKLLDFGIAKMVAQSTQAKTTRTVGTPLYMSPEQIRGEGSIGPRADLYSLGHIGYALLSGEAYWEPEARSSEAVYPLLVKVMLGAKESATARAAARGAELPAGFDAWFAKATALDPQSRFETASELVEELASVLEVTMPRATSSEVLHSTKAGPAPAARPREAAPAVAAPTKASEGAAREAGTTNATVPVSSDPLSPLPRRSVAPLLLGGGALVALAAVAFAWSVRSGGESSPPTEALSPSAPEVTTPAPSSAPETVAPQMAPLVAPAEATGGPSPAPAASAKGQYVPRPAAPPASAAARAPAPTESARAVAPTATAAARPVDPTDIR